MKIVKKVLKAAVSKAVKGEINEWPPVCIGVIYRPAHPKRREAAKRG